MKVALIVPGGVDRSGVDRVIPCLLWFIERLARRHEVHVFATRQETLAGDWPLLGSTVHNIGMGRGTTRRLLARFASEHHIAPFDVVHAFFGMCGTYAATIGWRYSVPVVFHAAGGEFVSMSASDYGIRRSALGRLAMGVAVSSADRVTVASQAMRSLAAGHKVDAQQVELGVALDSWPPATPRARNTERPARLLHVGDIRPVKDQHMLMAAAARLHDRGISFELDMVGLDTMNGAMQRSATAERVAGRTRYHGVLHRAELRALMDGADLLLVSSRHEAGPLVVLEAAVAGVPTVGTAVGHIADWAPTAAVAVSVGDDEALANAVAALLADDDRRLAIAHEAQRRALAIDANYTASRFEAIYHELAANR
ncbi:MAG TPA: glycosyltransferase family 4 protein [Gemmatimonadaceae bacterium]|jgi:glycosyltransferase involved in cell wall biosynthesis